MAVCESRIRSAATMPSERWWTMGGPIPAQRFVYFVNPRGVAGLRVQELVYWEVWGGQFSRGEGGTENNNLLPASCGGSWRRCSKGAMSQCQLLFQPQHLNYTFHILRWALSDWDVTS